MRVSTTRRLPVVGVSTVGCTASPPAPATTTTSGWPTSAPPSPRPRGGAAAGSAARRHRRADALAAGELATARRRTPPRRVAGSVVLRGTAAGGTPAATPTGPAPTWPWSAGPRHLGASLVDTLVGDVAGDGAGSPGDTVRYTLTVANVGGLPLPASRAVPAPARDVRPRLGHDPRRRTVSRAEGEAPVPPRRPRRRLRRGELDVVAALPFAGRLRAHRGAGQRGGHGHRRRADRRPGPARCRRPDAHLRCRAVSEPDGLPLRPAGDRPRRQRRRLRRGTRSRYSLAVSSVGALAVHRVGVTVRFPPARRSAGSVTTTAGHRRRRGAASP